MRRATRQSNEVIYSHPNGFIYRRECYFVVRNKNGNLTVQDSFGITVQGKTKYLVREKVLEKYLKCVQEGLMKRVK